MEMKTAERPNIGAFRDGERAFLFVFVAREAKDTLALEDAAIDAEDILAQAEEANALDPVR